MQCGDIEKLIKKRFSPDESPMYYVSIEDTYDVIKSAHIARGHGGRDRMSKEINKSMPTLLAMPWNFISRTVRSAKKGGSAQGPKVL